MTGRPIILTPIKGEFRVYHVRSSLPNEKNQWRSQCNTVVVAEDMTVALQLHMERYPSCKVDQINTGQSIDAIILSAAAMASAET